MPRRDHRRFGHIRVRHRDVFQRMELIHSPPDLITSFDRSVIP